MQLLNRTYRKLCEYKENFYRLKMKQKTLLLEGTLHEKQTITLLIKHLATHEKTN